MSGEIIIKGVELWKLPDSLTWTPEKGDIVTHNYKGTKEAIADFQEQLKADPFVQSIQVQGAVNPTLSYIRPIGDNTLIQTDDNNAQANATWELSVEQIDTNIKACPDFKLLKDHLKGIILP